MIHPAGTKILCNYCSSPLLETVRELEHGELITDRDVKALEYCKEDFSPGTGVFCTRCGNMLMHLGNIEQPDGTRYQGGQILQ